MIQILRVIEYLRPLVPNFRFDAAAELANAKDDSRLMVESGNFVTTIFVMLGGLQTATLSFEALEQTYKEKLSFIACINNQTDRTGKYAQQMVFDVRNMLNGLLLNYQGFDLDSHPLIYLGDSMLEMDRARYWHKFDFELNGRLTPADGAQLNLDVFNEYVANWNSTNPIAENPLATDDVTPLYYIPD